MKKYFSLFLVMMLCLTLSTPVLATGDEKSNITQGTAKAYYNVLQQESILKEDYVRVSGYDYLQQTSLLKQDYVPFSDIVTGTIAFLDVTEDGEAELLFLTESVLPDLQFTQRKLLNIYTQENGKGKLLYQGQVNYNAVLSHTEYEIYQLASSGELYCYTSFAEGGSGSTTYKRLIAENGQITEHVLKEEESFSFPENNRSYFLDGSRISEAEYLSYEQTWTGGNHRGVIQNTDTNTQAMTYDNAIIYLQTVLQTVIVPAAVSVTVNSTAVQWTDAVPFIDENSRTMVPLRVVAEALGLTVNWDGAKREAIFTDGTKTIYFPIGNSAARTGDGGTLQMDTAAVIVNDRTFAPIRYLAEYFGFSVGWDGASRTVLITENNQPTEAELRTMIPASKVIQLWAYRDYDFDGHMEAFALAVSTGKKTNDTIFDSVFFVNSNGAQQIKENSSMSSSYVNAETCCREYGGKVFFAINNGAGGSEYNTLLFSVKNGAPYELALSGSIQGFFEQDGKMCTTMNDFSKGYHTYPVYELIYDTEKQEFSVGAKIADDS